MFLVQSTIVVAIAGLQIPSAQPALIVAPTWEVAERILGEEPTFFLASGAAHSPRIMKAYPESGAVLWMDPFTGLIVGFAKKERAVPIPARVGESLPVPPNVAAEPKFRQRK